MFLQIFKQCITIAPLKRIRDPLSSKVRLLDSALKRETKLFFYQLCKCQRLGKVITKKSNIENKDAMRRKFASNLWDISQAPTIVLRSNIRDRKVFRHVVTRCTDNKSRHCTARSLKSRSIQNSKNLKINFEQFCLVLEKKRKLAVCSIKNDNDQTMSATTISKLSKNVKSRCLLLFYFKQRLASFAIPLPLSGFNQDFAIKTTERHRTHQDHNPSTLLYSSAALDHRKSQEGTAGG